MARDSEHRAFNRLSSDAINALFCAQQEAQRCNHTYIGTEHLLLGLLREGAGLAAGVFAKLGIDLSAVRAAVQFVIGRGDQPVLGEVHMTPRARKVLELAFGEARELDDQSVNDGHILLGLLRQGDGIALAVLTQLGVNLEELRAETLAVMAERRSAR